MAKDPAVLFYTSDFLSGTFTMTDDQVGKYIRLLCLQHQKGGLSEKDMLSVCKAYDEQVFDKFEKEGNTFFNKRMKEESEKRRNFCESRRKSAQTTKNQTNNPKAYAKRMENANENINEDVNSNGNTNFGKSENLLLIPEMLGVFKKFNPKYPTNEKKDFRPLFDIATFFCEHGKLTGSPDLHRDQIIEVWEPICKMISKDNFYSTKTLSTISNQIQSITQTAIHGKPTTKNGKQQDYGSKERGQQYDGMLNERYGSGGSATGKDPA